MNEHADPLRTTTEGEGQPAPAPPVSLPTHIGCYRVERLLGQGGFGRVFLAHDDQLHRPVAIKVPHREWISGPDDVEAYLVEARILASLDHPHIVPVYVADREEGLPFVVSKFIEGGDLKDRLKVRRLSLIESAELVATIAEALHYAHRKGLVHRDIKPANILIDTAGKPYVADFGLALKEEDFGKGARFAGTPAYMSPEQARGEGHRVDGRSDIFSLGVVFYELLTGGRPFTGDTQEELLEQITSVEARPPRQVDDQIPKELDRICLKALSKRASDRYLAARDMADDLRHWIISPVGDRIPAKVGPDTSEHVAELELVLVPGLSKDAFLSYASADRDFAYRLCRLLEEQGIGCWIAPRDVTPGDNYAAAIVRAIDETATTLLLLSSHSNASIHVAHEVERATSKRKRLIPIRLEDVQPGPSLELHLAAPHWLDAFRLSPDQVVAQLTRVLRGERLATPSLPAIPPSITPISDSQALRIVPKGLRSFDANDADFFLELLPGPRDRDGLPDSIRFWKTRIKETDPDNTFAVGLIYGPSGCGKSSLVKAGLLPRLSDNVIAVYIEATGQEAESRLLNGLRKRCPTLPADLGLKESLAALRRGQGIPAGKKVLIVLDQFEQWLHAKKEEQNTELVQALRQCNGSRVQCLVMVRDDFWLAVSRFVRDLEVDLVPGRNIALVDLFDLHHARKVLAAFGRAFGKLPENTGETSKEQTEFLNQAVSGLAQEGKVISVRLALFAEMLKGKTWTPATLKDVGGTEGVGVTFLEETFSSQSANPRHRLHQKAARTVLKALLPESGSDIKGHMRSYAELLAASGYASRPRDFDDLLRILDGELRLITPTDPEGAEESRLRLGDPSAACGVALASGEASATPQAAARYYQLTHDYLVHSLRDWLTRKQKETRRGRAELLLADRTGVWNARPENRQLPSLPQWVGIRLLTRKKDWTPPQRKMMQKAGRYHVTRGVAVAAVLLLLVGAGWEGFGRLRAVTLRDRLLEATTADVPGVVRDMKSYRRWLDGPLHQAYADAEASGDARKQLHASLALLPSDPGQVDYLQRRLLNGGPDEVIAIRTLLAPHKGTLVEPLWAVLEDGKADPGQRLRAACALAAYAQDDGRWEKVSSDVAGRLVAENALVVGKWAEALKPVGRHLLQPLAVLVLEEKRSAAERRTLTGVYAIFAEGVPNAFAPLEAVLVEKSNPNATAGDRLNLMRRQADEAVVLAALGRWENVAPLLRHTPDPTRRSYLIDRLAGGVEPRMVIDRLNQEREPDVSARRALLLALGEFDEDRLPPIEREALGPRFLELYRDDPDPGIHGVVGWLLRKWGQQKEVEKIDTGLATGKMEGQRQWYVNGQRQTFTIVPPGEFETESDPEWDTEPPRALRGRV